jgi:N-acyl homoserine lactone hydrolase
MLRARDVVRLHMGHFIAPGHLPFPGAAVVVTAFLVRHPSGPVLLDTGIGVGMPEVEAMYRPERRPLDEVLRDAGTAPGEIRAVANCHLHFDHSGNNFRFPNVPILAQKVEREAAAAPNYTLPGPVAEFDGALFELLEGEAEIVPGVRIVPTPGHVPGHQSFVVDTQEGRIVIAGQAFQDAAMYARDLYAWRLDSAGSPHPEYAPWVARLQEFDPWRVTFAHDLAIWQRGA